MVQLAARFVFLLSVATVAFSAAVQRDVPTVEADVAAISTKVTSLDTLITAFPLTGGTLLAALNIHTSAAALVTTVTQATTDVGTTGPLSEADGTTILNSVTAIQPIIQDALNEIVAKKPAFKALPIGGLPALILQDLKNLKTNTVAFSTALIASSPADLVAQASSLRDTIVASFDPAIAAYS